jgi:hypothetical protein
MGSMSPITLMKAATPPNSSGVATLVSTGMSAIVTRCAPRLPTRSTAALDIVLSIAAHSFKRGHLLNIPSIMLSARRRTGRCQQSR